VDAIKHRRVAAGRQAWQWATGRVLEEVLENWPVFESGFGGAVQRPLMPKGVEHKEKPDTVLSRSARAETSDAERR
jgi:hypothetical protein